MPDYPDYQTKAVSLFMTKAKQEQPLLPTIPSLEVRKLRAKLILEEALETINIGLGIDVCTSVEGAYSVKMGDLQFEDSAIYEPNLQGLADGCADLKVVTVGTELACGINGRPVFDEVMRSNMTKFKGGTVREDGKILKGPHYTPPEIASVLREQGWKP